MRRRRRYEGGCAGGGALGGHTQRIDDEEDVCSGADQSLIRLLDGQGIRSEVDCKERDLNSTISGWREIEV